MSSAALPELGVAEWVPAKVKPAWAGRVAARTQPPTLSVTVLNYNYGRYLRQCLDSILSQSFTEFEVIVIDDCSDDDSLEILEEYLCDERVRVVAHRQNLGYTSSLVEGTEVLSRGEFVSVISADDMALNPHAFELQIGLLHQDSSVTFCFTAFARVLDDGSRVDVRSPMGGGG